MKKLMVLLAVCVFVITTAIPSFGAEATRPGVAQKIDIKQLQESRKAAKIPLNRTSTTDLRCEIKVFYDQARTKPLSGGIYDWGMAIYPKLIYYDITVENTAYSSERGTKAQSTKAQKTLIAHVFNVKIDFITPNHNPLTPGAQIQIQTFTQPVINLGPGESHVLSFYGGPPMRGEQPSHFVQVVANVDPENKVKEESETNNQCSYKVSPK